MSEIITAVLAKSLIMLLEALAARLALHLVRTARDRWAGTVAAA
ncbi:hypothetical protein [Actinomadura rugatobispora]|uniref:Uncharacterized protein n=1 Tax=Actinomadura rugatobispora TaxID=1994 RepID=A0ABW1A0J4_9ACTN|nr:hypothetical protein GCM10010200_107060 [Actinomadura rugatobispora]